MQPVITLTLGGLLVTTSSYRLFLILAAVITLGVGMIIAARRGLPPRRTAVCLFLVAGAVPLGARLLYVSTTFQMPAEQPVDTFGLDLAGFSLYGGLILASGVGLMACRLLSLDALRLADSATPAMGIGIATMRVGCFLAGCSFGKVTDLPWGVRFPFGSDAHLYQISQGLLFFSVGGPLPVHPTQLYESLAGVSAAAISVWLLRKRAHDGVAFFVAVLWFDSFRLVNHFLRAQTSPLSVPDWFYPALYLTVLVVASVATLRLVYSFSQARARLGASLGHSDESTSANPSS